MSAFEAKRDRNLCVCVFVCVCVSQYGCHGCMIEDVINPTVPRSPAAEVVQTV